MPNIVLIPVQKQWKSLLPSMVAKAITLDVIHAGDSETKDGIVQLVLLFDPKHQQIHAITHNKL